MFIFAAVQKSARTARRWLPWAGLFLLQAAPALAQERPAAVPDRPGIAAPAALTAPGWLEVELGLERTRVGRGERSAALPYSLKLAFTPDWGIRIDGEAWQRSRQAGEATSGGGDTALILKRRFEIDDRSAFGLEAGVSLPTAGKTLGSGSNDLLINGIFSSELGSDWQVDLNIFATRFGGSSIDLGRVESGWAAAASRSLGERWELGAEFSGTRRKGEGSTSQLLLSASYASTRSTVWDVGFSHGLTSASPDWTVFTGVTFVALKLF
jgi:hypothetical protein